MYKMMHMFHWLNKPIALIVPGLAGIYNIFLIRQFMMAIPDVILNLQELTGQMNFVFTGRLYCPVVSRF